MKSKNNLVYWVIGIVVVLAVVIFALRGGSAGDYDVFAQCLTTSGAKMYGAYWCPHCQNQKELFGNSWDKIDYIECSLPGGQGQTQECQLAGIQGYPTWEFGDGSRVSGEMDLKQLSSVSGCGLE